jgi:hypothetical protein
MKPRLLPLALLAAACGSKGSSSGAGSGSGSGSESGSDIYVGSGSDGSIPARVPDGVRLVYAFELTGPPLVAAARVVQARLAEVKVAGVVSVATSELVLDLDRASPELVAEVTDVMYPGQLAITLVDSSAPVMRAIYDHVVGDPRAGTAADPAALAAEITGQVDMWSTPAGDREVDHALYARDRSGRDGQREPGRDRIDAYLTTLGSTDAALAIPADRRLVYELVRDDQSMPGWRTYLVDPAQSIAAPRVASARLAPESSTELRVDLDEDGKTELADLTTKHPGKRLAFQIDGGVVVAPIVEAPLTGGAFAIPVESEDRGDQLGVVLRTGPIPRGTLEYIREIKGGAIVPGPRP